MFRTGETTINLTTAGGVSEWVRIANSNKVSCEIIPVSTYATLSWVVDLEWVLCIESLTDHAQAFSPAVQADFDTQYIVNQSVTNRGYWRLHTSTGEPGADPAARVVWHMR